MIAEEVVVQISAKVQGVQQSAATTSAALSSIERTANRVEGAMRKSMATIDSGTAQAAMRSRLLGYQISDIGTQLAGGQSPFLILAQQAPQVANALDGTTGAAGKLASFFSGPWGAALLAAGSVLGILISKLGEADEATLSHANAAKTLEQAMDDLDAATGRSNQSHAEEINLTRIAAAAKYGEAVQTRQQTIETLQLAKARALAANAGAVGGRAANFGGMYVAQNAERDVERLQAAIGQLDKQIARAQQSSAGIKADALLLGVEARTDKATAATQRYDSSLNRLRRSFEAGKISEAAFSAEAEKLTRVRDAEMQAAGKSARATKGDGDAKREAAKAARELTAAQRELEQVLARVVSKFDPLRALAKETSATLADINKLEQSGQISAADAFSYKLKLAGDQAKAVADAAWKAQEDNWKSVGVTAGEMDGSDFRDKLNREITARQEANQQVADDFARRQEEKIQTLAGLFETAFKGGTGAIWDEFKNIGLRVIAEVLAKFVLANVGGGGGGGFDFGGAISSAIGAALPGFASGGEMVIGGKPGHDRNTLSLNGKPIARVSRGETLGIQTARAAAAGGATTVISAPQFDLRGVIMTERIYADMQRIADESAQRAGIASYKQSMRDAPTAISRAQRYGHSR